MEDKKEYVTPLELERSHNQLRSDLNKKIGVVDDKVDNLRDIVLPMVRSSEQTAENTKKMAESMERFTEAQRQTNGKFYQKLGEHDITFKSIEGQFSEVGIKLQYRAEDKSNNAKIWVAIIGLVGIAITIIFQAASYLFN